jgi:hypothetical protein
MTLLRASLSFAAGAALPIAVAAAQLPGPVPREKDPPSQQTRMQEKRLSLIVNGCVRGKRLVLSSTSITDGTAKLLNADELLLDGPKELMLQLQREHANHDDELTGVAILPPSPDGSSTTDATSTPIGKRARITLGVRESNGVAGDVRRPVRFRVASLRHVHDACTRT